MDLRFRRSFRLGDVPATAPGIEVAELPHEEIDITAARVPDAPVAVEPKSSAADGETPPDTRLVPLALALVAVVAAVAVLWALLV